MPDPFVTQVARCLTAQFVIDDWHQLIKRFLVALTPAHEQLRYVLWQLRHTELQIKGQTSVHASVRRATILSSKPRRGCHAGGPGPLPVLKWRKITPYTNACKASILAQFP